MTQQLHILDPTFEDQTDRTASQTPQPDPPASPYEAAEDVQDVRGVFTFQEWRFVQAVTDELEKRDLVADARLVDTLDTSTTDDVDLGVLLALPDDSLLFVGSDPTAKDAIPLFAFLVERHQPIPAPQSAEDALELLRPGVVRDAFAREEDEPDRQGEWWLLPTEKVPTSEVFRPGVDSRPFGPSPLGNHVPREYGFTCREREFLSRVRERVPELPGSIESAPEVMEWVHRQHQKRPVPEYAPEWDAIQDAAGEILVRGTLRHRENDHYVENLGDAWHTAETHDMDVYTGDELIDRVRLD